VCVACSAWAKHNPALGAALENRRASALRREAIGKAGRIVRTWKPRKQQWPRYGPALRPTLIWLCFTTTIPGLADLDGRHEGGGSGAGLHDVGETSRHPKHHGRAPREARWYAGGKARSQ
jgi:hypothetical protein